LCHLEDYFSRGRKGIKTDQQEDEIQYFVKAFYSYLTLKSELEE